MRHLIHCALSCLILLLIIAVLGEEGRGDVLSVLDEGSILRSTSVDEDKSNLSHAAKEKDDDSGQLCD